jgi:hypothetical protein
MLIVLVLALCASVHSTSSPVILSVSPSVGGVLGGSIVRIFGSSLVRSEAGGVVLPVVTVGQTTCSVDEQQTTFWQVVCTTAAALPGDVNVQLPFRLVLDRDVATCGGNCTFTFADGKRNCLPLPADVVRWVGVRIRVR